MPHSHVTLAILLIMSLTWCSAAKPLHQSKDSHFSAFASLQTRELQSVPTALDTSIYPTQGGSSNILEKDSALAKRADGPHLATCKMMRRYQHSVIYPSILCANALLNFWQRVALNALYHANVGLQKTIATFTYGRLQATFSCLGTNVPWGTVHDVAMTALEDVRLGWTDTFDAVYEEMTTGSTLWMSLRVLDESQARIGVSRK